MAKQVPLFKIFGITVRIDFTFILLIAAVSGYYGWQYGTLIGMRMLVLLLGIFACVLIHEFSHSVVARRFGIQVPAITLYLVGGIASMARIPRDPKKEFLITLAGPLSNFVLAAVLYFPLRILLGAVTLRNPGLTSWQSVVAAIYWANPVLGAFNLIPAFPMDGGRLLRATLARAIGYVRATQISVLVGQIFAILFAILGIWKRHWMLAAVAGFVFMAAQNEWDRVRAQDEASRPPETH